MHSKGSHKPNNSSAFEKDVLNFMQILDDSSIDNIFITQTKTLIHGDDDDDTRCYRVVIWNGHKHIFIDTFVRNIFKKYTQSELTTFLQ